jgi:Uncharacterized ABC-type transport system, periplasmic component/surface lipoprotein
MIANTFGTQSFNDDIKTGVDAISAKYGVENICLEVPEVSDVANSLRTLIAQKVNFLIISSADYYDGMLEIAEENPDVKFLYLSDGDPKYDNIVSTQYAENEGAYLVGALAAMLSKEGNIGAIAAVKGDSVQEKYLAGFVSGARKINPSITVQTAYTNSYADINKGNEVATVMYKKGADIVSCFAGACNLGVFNAANAAGEGKYCFGAAKGQFDKMPNKIIASLVKPVDLAVISVVGDYIENGKFEGGTIVSLGVANDGVIAKFTDQNPELRAMITPEMEKTLEDLKAQIISGAISVPTDSSALK